MAALSSMDHGRRQLWRLTKAAEAKFDNSVHAAHMAAAWQGQRTRLELKGFELHVNAQPLLARASALSRADF